MRRCPRPKAVSDTVILSQLGTRAEWGWGWGTDQALGLVSRALGPGQLPQLQQAGLEREEAGLLRVGKNEGLLF